MHGSWLIAAPVPMRLGLKARPLELANRCVEFPQKAAPGRFIVAKDFDLHSNDKGKSGQQPPRRDPIPFDSRRRARNNDRPIDSDKGESEASWLGLWPGSSAGAEAVFLLGIAILCGLYSGGNDKKPTATSSKSDEQLRSGPTSQPSSPVGPLSKPSPIIHADTLLPKGSIVPRQALIAVSNVPGFSALHYLPMKYEATHKKMFGGCTGRLELTSARLHFRCSNQADLNFPVDAIAKAHKDGVVLKSGQEYHFLIANHTKGQVEAIFTLWMNSVRQFQQTSQRSSFLKSGQD